jgi:hypothetical protein
MTAQQDVRSTDAGTRESTEFRSFACFLQRRCFVVGDRGTVDNSFRDMNSGQPK